jgi:riboflavin-specific deaminase-like protein
MHVIASIACSADGYVDDRTPQRLKLSTPSDWDAVMMLRAACDAILVGGTTVRHDNPSLTVRGPRAEAIRAAEGSSPQPLRVVLSHSLHLDTHARIFGEAKSSCLLFTDNPSTALDEVATVIHSPALTPEYVYTELERRGIRRLLIEGGPHTLSQFLDAHLVDELRVAVNPAVVVGDPLAPAFLLPEFVAAAPHTVERLGAMQVTAYRLIPDCRADDLRYLTLAVEQSRRCTPCATSYCVGAVIRTRRGELFTGYTHESNPTHHAEQEAIAKALAVGADLQGATIYSSMEPCSARHSEPLSCSELILQHHFSRTVFALYEPDCFVRCQGALLLRRQGIDVRVYPELADAVYAVNRHICGGIK